MEKKRRLIAMTAALALCLAGLAFAHPEAKSDPLEVTYYYLPG